MCPRRGPQPGLSLAGGPSIAWQYASVKTKHSAEEKTLKTPTTVEIKILCQDPKWVQKTLCGKIHNDILGLFTLQCCLSLALCGSSLRWNDLCKTKGIT